MCPHTTTALAYVSSYHYAVSGHLYTSALILPLTRVYLSSYYHCARLYMCPHTTTRSAVTYILAYHCARLYMCPHTTTRSVCPHTTTALAYICVLILLCPHLHIHSALILRLARVYLPPRSGWTTTKTARKQLQQRIRRRRRRQA
jgi:hypothetical protein